MNQNEFLENLQEKKKQIKDKIKKLQRQLDKLIEQENSYIANEVKELMEKNNITLSDLTQLFALEGKQENEEGEISHE